MKNWKLMAAGMALAGTLAVPGPALAHDESDRGSHHHKHHKHHMFERLTKKLDLTEGQKAQLKADREAGREARKAQREQMRELHKQIREAIDSGADQATLDNLGAQLGKLHVARMQQMHQKRQQVRAILTDEQKAKLEQLKAERKERWMEKRKRRHRDEE